MTSYRVESSSVIGIILTAQTGWNTDTKIHVVVLAAGILTLLLSGCTAAKNGPIAYGGSPSENCVSMKPNSKALIGEIIKAKSVPIVLQQVRLRNAVGVKVLKSYLLDTHGGPSVGGTDVPPPPNIDWSYRVVARDVTIPAGSTRNIILEVQRDSTVHGSASSMTISYSAGGQSFSQDGTTQYTFPASCTG